MNSFAIGLREQATELYALMPEVTAGQVGSVLVGIGVALLLHYGIQSIGHSKMWLWLREKREARRFAKAERLRKAKRTKEAMDIREVRLQELMVDMIGDGLLNRFADGTISGQEYRKLLKEFGERMGLNDLISTKSRSPEIKEAIRDRIGNDVHNRETITVDKCGRRSVVVKIPGPKPGEVTAIGSSAASTVGKLVNKYWRAKQAVS